MKHLRRLIRIIHINFVLVKHGLDKIVLSIPVFAPISFIAYFNPWNWGWHNPASRGARIREALEELGPIFVKFGQMLSTRNDLLPEDIAEELAKLQDNVPPFSGAVAQAIIEKTFNCPINILFTEFDSTPLASASIAQVHAVTLRNGKLAVIKIVRPGIDKTIRQDIDLLYVLAKLAQRFWSRSKRLNLVDVIAEFERTLFDELDLQREAANAALLRRNFRDSTILYIPEIYWEYIHDNIMVMERIFGLPISEVATLKSLNIDLKKLADDGVKIFFTQVFRDGFFHADMHPGNIFVETTNPLNPKYLAVDFGIMGTLNTQDKIYLAENFLAFFNRDYRRVTELHLESGWIAADTNLVAFESAIRTVCEPIFERPLKEISFGRLMMQLLQTGRRFHMQIQPQLILLQKTLINVEGLGRKLYPDLDLWSNAKPFLEDWMRQQTSLKTIWKKSRQNIPYWVDKLPNFPLLVYDTLQAVKENHKRSSPLPSVATTHLMQKKYKRRGFLQGISIATVLISLLSVMGIIVLPTLQIIIFLSIGLAAMLSTLL